ncbi:MAG: hypothetical protein HN919_00335 [Verrucomicrobia bacterium]|jgi:hypothetical protein|nr:hypothetical protein [Verrucomicrobiota bacterium]
MTRIASIFLLLAWTAFISWSLLCPRETYNRPKTRVDQVRREVWEATNTWTWWDTSCALHVGYFGGQAALASVCLLAFRRFRLLPIVFSGAAVFAYGFAIELAQKFFVIGRSLQKADVLSNASGVLIVALVAVLASTLTPNPRPLPSALRLPSIARRATEGPPTSDQ